MKGPWSLQDIKQTKNVSVFSCFHCGGGSTMGYKLAGFKVLGGVELDKDMMEIYRENFNPSISYQMAIQDFNKKQEYPDELYNLDILDGSPPCSTFSMNGKREKKWGDKHKFREGQAIQNLDDLFFDFIKTVNILKPKVVIAENVKGLMLGNAKGYVKQIFTELDKIGYTTQLFLLNAASMGVPQRRERVFFLSTRKDLKRPKIKLHFTEKPITYKKMLELHNIKDNKGQMELKTKLSQRYNKCKPGKSFSSVFKHIGNSFSYTRLSYDQVPPTLTNDRFYHPKYTRRLTTEEYSAIQSFPYDYNFLNKPAPYILGMSVPPFMMERIAKEVYSQWLDQKSK
jgi:DNA (cytosine-5)-methyltransferase 1